MANEDSIQAAPHTTAKLAAEFFGTFLLVLGGVGTAVFSASFPDSENPLGVGFLGVAIAFGLTVLIGVYAVGHISGGHFNPAVTLGVVLAHRMPWKDVPGYWIAQLVGGVLASTVIYAIASGGADGFLEKAVDSGFASNGYAELSPGGFNLVSVIVAEVVLTAVFLYVILGATSGRGPAGFAGIAIGFTLTLIHLISIPISNTSVNPARSLAAAIYGGPEYLAQVWVFFVAPLAGALIAGLTYKVFFEKVIREDH